MKKTVASLYFFIISKFLYLYFEGFINYCFFFNFLFLFVYFKVCHIVYIFVVENQTQSPPSFSPNICHESLLVLTLVGTAIAVSNHAYEHLKHQAINLFL